METADPYVDTPVLESRQLRGVRRVIAKRLSESWRTVVPVTLLRDLDITEFIRMLEASKRYGAFDAALCAVAQSLLAHPEFNATFTDDTYRLYAAVHLGIAVDTDRGLVVPVIRNAHLMNVTAIETARRSATAHVQAWQHRPDELLGATFTVSNLGVLGIDYFTPIINPPQVAILGVGRIRRQSISWWPKTDADLRWLLPVSFTFDHRVADGADAARFLSTLQEELLRLAPSS